MNSQTEGRPICNSNRSPNRKSLIDSINFNVLLAGSITGIIFIVIAIVVINKYLNNKGIERELEKLKELGELKETKKKLEEELLDLYIKLKSRIEEAQVKESFYKSIYNVMVDKNEKRIVKRCFRSEIDLEEIINKLAGYDIPGVIISSMNDKSRAKEDILSRIDKLRKMIKIINHNIRIVEIKIDDLKYTMLWLIEESKFTMEDIAVLEEGKKRIKETVEQIWIKNKDIMKEFIERYMKEFKEKRMKEFTEKYIKESIDTIELEINQEIEKIRKRVATSLVDESQKNG